MTPLQHAIADAIASIPWIGARVLLGLRVDPKVRFSTALRMKLTIALGSLLTAVGVGAAYREYRPTAEYALLIVMASGFMAQDVVMWLNKRGKRFLNDNSPDQKDNKP